jgi:predicted DNA-binding transcriptional regulator AlpA
MKEGKELMTTQEVLAVLEISRQTLYNLMSEGRIAPVNRNPLLKKQSRLLFSRAEVERLKQGNR